MRRCLEPIDLMVAVGLCATALGSSLLFIAANGSLVAGFSSPISIESTSEMEWVQPILGQAIVDDYVFGREAARKTTAAVKEFYLATKTGAYLQTSPFEVISKHAADVEAGHTARVQFVMGRFIVDFTARGLRTGALSAGLYEGEYNQRMIRSATATKNKMDEEFKRNWQAILGQAIVTARQGRIQFANRQQERMGRAILQIVQTQDRYPKAMQALQEQLASAIVVTTPAHAMTLQQPLSLTEPRTWPDVPTGFLFAASAGLIGVFLVGLVIMLAGGPEQETTMDESRPEPDKEGYRKVA